MTRMSGQNIVFKEPLYLMRRNVGKCYNSHFFHFCLEVFAGFVQNGFTPLGLVTAASALGKNRFRFTVSTSRAKSISG